ncbi:MAG: hypothetical protein HUU29_11505, partial [Planctomycetaceae bacterium]|nr:hypothetical protein [Planctomycetaceae bacterium]
MRDGLVLCVIAVMSFSWQSTSVAAKGGELFAPSQNANAAQTAALAEVHGVKQLNALPETTTRLICFWPTIEKLKCLPRFKNLESLTLQASNTVTDDDLVELVPMSSLKSLTLDECNPLTAACMEYVKELKGLTELRVRNCYAMGKSWVEPLAELPNLERLTVEFMPAFDESEYRALAKINSLKHLTIEKCDDDEQEGMDALKSLKLKTLWINSSKFPHRCAPKPHELEAICEMQTLTSLTICLEKEAPGLEGISGLANIERLQLTVCQDGISEAGVRSLASLTKLKQLFIEQCVSPTVIPAIASLKGLEHLHVPISAGKDEVIGNEVLERIGSLASLKHLSIPFGSDSKIDATGAAALAKLTKLEFLSLWNARWLTDDAMAFFRGLPELRELYLRDCAHNEGTGYVALEKCKKLETFLSESCAITDEALSSIGKLKSLKRVWLLRGDYGGSALTNAGVAHLSKLSNLEYLEIGRMEKVTNEGLAELSKLKSLKRIELGALGEVTGKVFSTLSKITALEFIGFYYCGDVTGQDLSSLSSLKRLWGLDINGCLTDVEKAAGYIAACKRLDTLSIEFTDGVTDDAVAKLSKSQSIACLSLWG